MKNLEVGTKVDFYEVVSYKNGVYVLDDGYNRVTVDMEAKKIAFVERNNRCFKAEKFTKSFNFLISSIEELEAESVEEAEEVENLTDDLFQESDIAYAEEAIERESNKKEFDNMYQTIIEYINGLDEKELKKLYEKYYDMAFTFCINSDNENYKKAMIIINLIDITLREKGY